jgi:hypothetical protein
MRPFLSVLILSLLTAGPSLAQLLPAGSIVEGGIHADLTPLALDLIEDITVPFINDSFGSIPVPSVSTDLDCPLDCTSTMSVDVNDIRVELRANDLEFSTDTGEILIATSIDLRVNDPTAPMQVAIGNGPGRSCDWWNPCCWADLCPSASCSVHSEWLTIDLDLVIRIDAVSNGLGVPPSFDVTVLPPVHNLGSQITDDNLIFDCGGGVNFLLDIAGLLGFDITDLIAPQVEAVIDSLPATIEEALEDALNGGDLAVSSALDLGGAVVDLELFLADLIIDPLGIRGEMSASFTAREAADCIAADNPGGSWFTDHPAPYIAPTVPSTGAPYHLGTIVADDFINQALFAFWEAGALCQNLDELAGDVPLSFSTGLLGPIIGEAFTAGLHRIFLEQSEQFGPAGVPSAPVSIALLPFEPPLARFARNGVIHLDLPKLGLDFVTELRGRRARLFTVRFDLAAQIGLGFTQFGELELRLDLDTRGLQAMEVLYSELIPEAIPELEANLGPWLATIIDEVAGAFLGSMYLGPFVFPLGGVDYGIVDGHAEVVGPGHDYLELFSLVGSPAPGGTPGGVACEGCDNQAGCQSLGCADPADCADPATCIDPSQCALDHTHGNRARSAGAVLLLLPLVAMWRLRRH